VQRCRDGQRGALDDDIEPTVLGPFAARRPRGTSVVGLASLSARPKGPRMPHPRLRPRDHAEAVALFRAEIIGALVRRELNRGELAAALRALSQQRFRPPGSTHCTGSA
jgi:hypothetical protein